MSETVETLPRRVAKAIRQIDGYSIADSSGFLLRNPEEMADMNVVKALIDAAERGISVNIDMTYSDQWQRAFEELTTAGVHVRTYDPKALLYIHAKMILVDGARAFVGSENFSQDSLDYNRELGIVLTDPKIIAALAATFDSDWKSATLFSF